MSCTGQASRATERRSESFRLLRSVAVSMLRSGRSIVGLCASVGVLALTAVMLSGCGLPGPGDPAAASTHPTSAVQDLTKAQSLQATGHCDRAIPYFLSALLKNNSYVNAYTSLATCYQILGSYNAAIAEYDKAISVDPTNYGLYIGRAGIEAVSGNTGAASSDDAIALRLAPVQVPTYTSIATSFASYGDFADAIDTLNKAIALVPDNWALYNQRAGVYANMQDASHAYADYNRAIALAPNPATAAPIYSSLANVYDQQQEFDGAFRAIQSAIKLIKLVPGGPVAAYYVQSGSIHKDAGAYAAALSLYDQALRYVHKGTYAETAHEGKGDVLATIGQLRQAIDEYKLATRLTTSPDARARIKDKIAATRSGQ